MQGALAVLAQASFAGVLLWFGVGVGTVMKLLLMKLFLLFSVVESWSVVSRPCLLAAAVPCLVLLFLPGAVCFCARWG
jgi:hypothetical protein